MAIRLVEEEAVPPVSDIVDWAEALAQDARAGKVVSVFFALGRLDGTWATGSRGDSQNVCEVVGRIEALKLDLIHSAKVI
jgi:hypothetical protein